MATLSKFIDEKLEIKTYANVLGCLQSQDNVLRLVPQHRGSGLRAIGDANLSSFVLMLIGKKYASFKPHDIISKGKKHTAFS